MNPSDEQLMQRVAGGDVEAFRALFEKYKKTVFSYALAVVQKKSVADEITHEVFLRLYRTRENYADVAKFKTALWTLVRQCTSDQWKTKSEAQIASDVTLVPLDEHDEASLSAETERLAMDSATRGSIEKGMGSLSPIQREALCLRAFADQTYAEMAETLSLSVGAVKALLIGAKAGLIDSLKRSSGGS